MTPEQRQELLKYAREVIASRWTGTEPVLPEDSEFERRTGIFVSLHIEGELRGCIGYITGYTSIRKSIREMALAAAFRDPRFPALRQQELAPLEIEISILSELIPIKDAKDVSIGRDGLFIEHPEGSGLLLPQVAVEWNWDADSFLRQVCRKAGLPSSAWKDPAAVLYRFEAEVFGEEGERR